MNCASAEEPSVGDPVFKRYDTATEATEKSTQNLRHNLSY